MRQVQTADEARRSAAYRTAVDVDVPALRQDYSSTLAVQNYIRNVAAVLNVGLIAFAIMMLDNNVSLLATSTDVLFAVFLLVAPAFSLFALFMPKK
jgi:hypothetical protein